MEKTKNLQLNKPDAEDFYNIEDFNQNSEIIDEAIAEQKKSHDDHIADKENPHEVTKEQVGLSNVPNVATNDQTPTYTESSSLTNITSGEKISVAFGKIKKAISSLITHLADKVSHITATERTAWNSKAEGNHTHNYAGASSAGGSATSAVKLQNARTIQTKLNSTSSASFDGTANVTPGVTGTLPVANGGTGQTTLIDAEKALLTSLPTDTSSDMMDDYSFIPTLDQQSGSGMTWYTPRKRSFSRIWTYIQNKISSVLGLSTSGYTGNSASASKLNLPSNTYGSQTQPVYFTNGKPAACSCTISKSVPSDAKFTDTVYTHPTSSGNKHIPIGGSSGKLLRWNSDGTAEWSGATNGSATQPIYMNAGVPTACTYSLNKTVPSNAVFTDTNTWRPVQNNLTSTSTSDCLSANQGRILKGLIDGKPINTVESKCLTSTTSVSNNGAILTYTLTFTGTYIILIYLSNNSTGGAWFGTGSAIVDPTNVAYGTVSPGGTLMKILTITKTTTVGIWNETGSTKSYGCGTCFCCMRV